VPPSEFLPVIEGSPLEHAVGDWVIASGLAQAEAWHDQGLTLTVSVNVGANQLLQHDFADRLAVALARHPRLPRAAFELEVLESAAIADIAQAVTVMERCRALGVRFALDDFGTGYSSLTYLRRLPIDTLKIDQSFVRRMLDDAEDCGIVEGVIRLAAAFGREVIAEGVETAAHGERLLALGCRCGQGYGIARPMPAAQLPAWAADRGAR
jgi:EAL domain-containing protein (putative c-di-GMP-specific phosphodiesterase class I)